MGLLSKNSAGGVPNFSGFNGGMQQGIKNTNSLINSGERGYDRHRKNQALDAMGKAWASGDPAQLNAAMGAFPEYIGQMQKQMGVRDDQHRKDLGSMTARLHGLLNAGDTEGAKALVGQNANLFDKEGPYSAQGVSDMIDGGDPKKLKLLDNWAQSTTMGTLTPLEIIKEGDSQQRFGLDQQRINNQLQLGQERNQLGWANHNERQQYHDQMLNLRSQLSDKQQEIADRMNWNAWGTNNRDRIKSLGKTLDAEGRMERALASGTPVGDVSAMLQFMVQEAPNLSPRIAQAMGITDESAAGVLGRAQRSLQELATGKKLLPQQVKDLKSVGQAMKQSVMNGYYGVVSPALVGVNLADPKQAATAMKRTNLPLPALQHIQNNAGQYDQFGFGSGIPSSGDAQPQNAAEPPKIPLPEQENGSKSAISKQQKSTKPEGSTVTGKNGETYVTRNGYWVAEGGA
jgi:hypothetical protein